MSIFGDLSDLPFPEIFPMLGRRSGLLEITHVPSTPTLELHLDEGCLRGLRVGEEWIADPLHVRDRLIGLMDAESGQFRFHRTPNVMGPLRLPTMGMLMSIAAAVDEIGAYRNRFAHPETLFRDSATDTRLDPSLEELYTAARPYLASGISAEQLASRLALSLEQVQLDFYKLRSLGKITPIRGHAAATEPNTTPRAGSASPGAAAMAAATSTEISIARGQAHDPAAPRLRPSAVIDGATPAVPGSADPTAATFPRTGTTPHPRAPSPAPGGAPASSTRAADDERTRSLPPLARSGPITGVHHPGTTQHGFSFDLIHRMLRAMRQRVFAG